MKKISVIVPVYNSEKYLRRCIESILSQTYTCIELILIDDGSTDASPQICDSYSKKYENIIVIHQTNRGVSAARNVGINVCTGEYIGFVDADDYLASEMYSRLMAAIEISDSDMAICNYVKVASDETVLMDTPYVQNEVADGSTALKWINRNHGWSYILVMPRLTKREVFNGILFENGKIHEDEFIAHKLFLNCKRIVGISDLLYFYRQTENSIMTQTVSVSRLYGVEAVYERFCTYVSLGYEHLLRGTLECSKQSLSMIASIRVSSLEDKVFIRKIVSEYRYMVRYLGTDAGLVNLIISICPSMYYRLRRVLKKESI